MQSVGLLLRFTLLVLLVFMVANVDAQEADDVTDADIPTTAGTFYVRISGNDANAGTTPALAFRTIRRAAAIAPASSTIYVGAGTYTKNVDFVGIESTPAWPLRVVADTAGTRTGDSGSVILGPGTRMAFLGCDCVQVTGFTFQGPTGRCFEWRSSTQGVVQSCTFIGGTSGVKVRSGDIKFQDCIVKDFTNNGFDVFGTAQLFMVNCTIQNCSSAGLQMNRYARVTVDSSNFLDNKGDGLAVDAITSTDDGIIGISSNGMLLDARNLLAAAALSATSKGKDKLLDAVKSLDEALLPKYWQDAWHPHSKITKDVARSKGLAAEEGQDVFKKSKEALDKLKDFMENDAQKNTELGNFGTVKDNVNLAHGWVFEATQTMALVAWKEALLAGAKTKDLDGFENEYKKALKEVDKGHFHHAVEKFGKAWEKAAYGAGSGYALNPPITDNDNPADADAKKLLTVSSSKFRRNANGLRCGTAQKFDMRTSELTDNKQSGLSLVGGGRVEDCTISGNAQGVYLKDTTDVAQFKRLTISKNLQYGLFTESCNLTFSNANMPDWKISGSQYVLAGKTSDLTVQNVTISGGSIAGVQSLQGSLKATNAKFTGNGTGLILEDGNFTVIDCTLSRNSVGLNATKSKTLTVQRTQISDNTQWGVKLTGKGSFSDSILSGNGIGGFELTKLTSSDLTLARNSLTNNTTFGFYCIDSTITFNTATFGGTTITGSGTAFAGVNKSVLTFDGITVSGGSQFGIGNYGSKVTVNNCTLSGNGTGLYSDNGCSATQSTFTANTTTGASVLGTATFTQCLFEKSPNGLQITNDKTGSVKLVGSQIKDNTLYGVWCDACTLTFNAAMQANWSVQNNGSNFGATGSTLTFDGFTVSNGKTYGISSEKGTLNLNNSTLTANGTGVYLDANSTLVATSTKFTGNSSYGAHLQGNGTLRNCTITGNGSGLYLNTINVTDVNLTGTNISGNTLYGVYGYKGSLALTSQAAQGWSIASNGYNISGYEANITLTGVKLTDATSFGVLAQYGSLNVQQSTITSKSGGVWGLNTTGFTVDRSRVTGSKTGSWGVMNLNGGLIMRNSVVSGAQYGVYSSDASRPVSIYNTSIADASLYGLYVNAGNLTVMNTIISGTNGTYGLYRGTSANVTHSYNLVSGFASPFENTAADATELFDLPRFADAANGDYSLAKGSPAINSGADLSASLTTDMLGNARPSHKVFEIGAYEYMQDAGSLRVLDWKEKR